MRYKEFITILPSAFKDTIKKANGINGEIWLQNFNELIAYCKNKWQFELLEPYVAEVFYELCKQVD
jgi:hypothetical protein